MNPRSCQQSRSIAAPTSSFHIASRIGGFGGVGPRILGQFWGKSAAESKDGPQALWLFTQKCRPAFIRLLQEMLLMCTHNYIWHTHTHPMIYTYMAPYIYTHMYIHIYTHYLYIRAEYMYCEQVTDSASTSWCSLQYLCLPTMCRCHLWCYFSYFSVIIVSWGSQPRLPLALFWCLASSRTWCCSAWRSPTRRARLINLPHDEAGVWASCFWNIMTIHGFSGDLNWMKWTGWG